ncbi:MAG: ester cyclase [Chlamydiales bacterium]|nr:ester cyclase [Chlamydiales bacterium]
MDSSKSLAGKAIDANNKKDLNTLRELFNEDFKAYLSDWPLPFNKEQYLQGVEMGHKAFSSLNYLVEDIIAEKDKVVVRMIVQGVHTGEYQNLAPTNKLIEFASIAIYKICNGKISQKWQVNDQLTLLKQLQH